MDDLPTPTGLLPLDSDFLKEQLFQNMEDIVSVDHGHRGSVGFGDAMPAQLDTSSCSSPMPKPLDHVQSFSEVYGDAACVDHESDSCNSPTPKGKPLGYRQGDLVEHGDAGSHDSPTPKEKPLGSSGEHHDDAHALLGNSSTEASSSNFTLGMSHMLQHFVYSSQYYSLGHCASTIRGLIYLSQPSSQTNNSYNWHWGHPPVHDSPVISPQGLDFGNNSVGLDEMLDGKQELEHLQKSGAFTGSIDSTPFCKKCYELFKEYCDTWQEILIKFEESMQYTETGKTVAQ
ncbi:hypothetical protein EDC04DRAFT_2602200 [Pisolithus marmoratus]|nr:hypothetical protein EDC04DRAFT_2602200 [Pisolithus marmoratus]